MASLQDLPDEIIFEIFTFHSEAQLATNQIVSRQWDAIISRPALHKQRFLRIFSKNQAFNVPDEHSERWKHFEKSANWRTLYLSMCPKTYSFELEGENNYSAPIQPKRIQQPKNSNTTQLVTKGCKYTPTRFLYYIEFKVLVHTNMNMSCGLCHKEFERTYNFVGYTDDKGRPSYSYSSDGQLRISSGAVHQTEHYKDNDVVGILTDMLSKEVLFYLNGKYIYTLELTGLPEDTFYYPAITTYDQHDDVIIPEEDHVLIDFWTSVFPRLYKGTEQHAKESETTEVSVTDQTSVAADAL